MHGFLKSFFLRNRSWVLFMALVAGSGCLLSLYAMSSDPTVDPQPTEQKPDYTLPEVSLGNSGARHTVVMYFALDCTHCRHYEEKILPEIKKQFIKTGQIQFIFRDCPIGEAGLLASKICWAQRDPAKYQEMITKIFAKQDYWNGPEYKERLRQVALDEGFTEEELEKCMSDEPLEKAIIWQKFQAKDIDGVPTFVIDGQSIEDILTPDILIDFLDSKAKSESK